MTRISRPAISRLKDGRAKLPLSRELPCLSRKAARREPRPPMKSSCQRRGLTLFEVVLSLAIFLGALVALSELISTGSRAAVHARLQTQAMLRCQSKMAEVLVGVEPMLAVSDSPFEDLSEDWTWTLIVGDGPVTDLLELELTVTHIGPNDIPNASYVLNRYVRDPQLFLDAAAEAVAAELEE